jgi:hypothetical protein
MKREAKAPASPETPVPFDTIKAAIEATENPWDQLRLIATIEDRAERTQFLNPWLALVSKCPKAEQDSLLGRAKDAWPSLRVETARDQLKKVAEEQQGTRRFALGLAVADAFMAETVYRPGADKPLGYMVQNLADPTTRPVWVESIEYNKAVYVPPSGLLPLLERGVFLLPSDVEEDYGDPAALIEKIKHHIITYVQLPPDSDFLNIAAIFVLLSWGFDRFNALPYLRAIGDFGAGKTRLIETVGRICYRPTFLGGATTAAPIFRIIEKVHGTLVVDEGDYGTSEVEETIIKILTQGYKAGFPVLRAEAVADGGHDVQAYDVYGPKLLSMRKPFRDGALESRCLSQTMAVSTTVRHQPVHLPKKIHDEALQLRNLLLLWRFRTWASLDVEKVESRPLFGLEPRIIEMGLPLLAVAPPAMHPLVIEALRVYSEELTASRQESWEGIVLGALARHFRSATASVLIKDLVDSIELDGIKLHPRTVAGIVRRTFKFRTGSTHGRATVSRDDAKLSRLLKKYGLLEEKPAAPLLAPWSDNGFKPTTTPAQEVER